MNRVWYFLMRHVYPRERWLYDHCVSYRRWWGER
jgi:hypothetical protein